jgi:hypothetical protein
MVTPEIADFSMSRLEKFVIVGLESVAEKSILGELLAIASREYFRFPYPFTR